MKKKSIYLSFLYWYSPKLIPKTFKRDNSKILTIVFFILTLHSFIIGCCLICHPSKLMHILGFTTLEEDFFLIQGGGFHLLMCFIYIAVLLRIEGHHGLILICVLFKYYAFLFLLYYYIFVNAKIIFLLSGIVDGIMATAIITVYIFARKSVYVVN